MIRPARPLALLAAGACAALLLAACGGGGDDKGKTFTTEGKAAVASVRGVGTQVAGALQGASNATNAQLSSEIDAITTAGNASLRLVDALKAPNADQQKLVTNLSSALKTALADLTTISDAVTANDATKAKSATEQFITDSAPVQAANNALGQAVGAPPPKQ